GGGGGGSILLDVDSIAQPSDLTLDVSGGDGASLLTSQQHGPGGGGGGGLINSPDPLPTDIHTITDGGDAGLFVSTDGASNPYHNTNHGATAGKSGAIIHNLYLPICSAPPSLDLNGNDWGNDYLVTYLVGSPPISITDSTQTDIQDLDDSDLEQMTVTLTNPINEGDESLDIVLDSAQLADLGLQVIPATDGHSLTFLGSAPLETYIQILASITYDNSTGSPDFSSRIIEITVDDGGAISNLANSVIRYEPGILAVGDLQLQLQADGPEVSLLWEPSQTEGTDRFDVQRKDAEEDWTIIGQKFPHERSPGAPFRFRDRATTSEEGTESWYRIRQLKSNGTLSYSNTVEHLAYHAPLSLTMEVFPNPTSEQIQIAFRGVKKGGLRLTILQMDGKIIRDMHQPTAPPQGQLSVPVQGLSSGSYLIRLQSQHQRIEKKVLIH
ncbi:MAG: T9SS type A sorting domain-containing protein, partial [Bacteroidota bacterium]